MDGLAELTQLMLKPAAHGEQAEGEPMFEEIPQIQPGGDTDLGVVRGDKGGEVDVVTLLERVQFPSFSQFIKIPFVSKNTKQRNLFSNSLRIVTKLE